MNPPSYVNLHSHTQYSMLDGQGSPDRYMERAAELGMESLAITDHGNISGILDFYQAGQEHGVKPILGEEFYQARKTRFDQDEEEISGKTNADLGQRGPYHLIGLARNEAGYRNLIKMSSQAYLTGFYGKPRIDHQLISEHSDGLTILSGCLSGELQRALLRDDFNFALDAAGRMQDIVGKENYFIEIQDHDIPEQHYVRDGTIEIAKRLGALIVPTGDCHYVHQEDWESHDTLLCIQTGAKKEQEGRFKFAGPHFYLQSYEEMLRKFPAEWLANTLRVSESVDLELHFGTFYFPDFPIPDNHTYDSFLEENVWAGLKDRYGWCLSQEVVDRANYELNIVKEMGFQSYFLVVADLVSWARTNGIRMGVGRGSAASSIISYALRITGLDPLKFNLLFERFLVPGRKSMPDIDLDMDDRYRDKIIAYSKEKYGSDHVANICTFTSIAARSAIRDSARVLDYEYAVGDKIAKLVPLPIQGFSKSLKESLDSPDLQKVYVSDNDAKKIIDSAIAVEGVIRQTGIHAAGIVIAKSNITNFVPVMQGMKKGIKGPVTTQWDMDWVEKNGILKIDFLGLRNLAVIDIAIANIKERHGIEIETDAIPLDDEITYDSLCTGESSGLFQLECLSGDTIVSNSTIRTLAKTNNKKQLQSIYLDDGKVRNCKVNSIVFSGNKKVHIIRTKNGRMIKATLEHEFLTDDGWKKLRDIKTGDRILFKEKAKYVTYNKCNDCGVVTDGTNRPLSNRCYRCSANFHSNPSHSKEKISAGRKRFIESGGNVWNKGKPWNAEMREKLSKAQEGITWNERYGVEKANAFRKITSERMRGEKNHMFGKLVHARGGYRSDLGHYVRSTWEADFARVLIKLGQVYQYEPRTFVLIRKDGSKVTYTPDFFVEEINTFFEVKGYMREKDQEKINLFLEQYPEFHFILIDKTQFAELALQFKDLVDWECPVIPDGFDFVEIVDIEEGEVEDTYDVIMETGPHNFVANSFVVHNSGGMRSMMVSMKPNCIEDLMALVSLYRPGPLGSNMDKTYIARKHGHERIVFDTPELAPILKNTYGVMLYQENILSISRELANFTAAEADDLRKAMGKKQKDKIGLFREKFVEGAYESHGIDRRIANKIYSDIEFFGAYGFNIAHAASYGVTAYWTAYLKAHYPVEYMAALLSTVSDKPLKLGIYLNECRRMGITVYPPSINKSKEEFIVLSDDEILFGLISVRGVGESMCKALISCRDEPYSNIYDFMRRVDGQVLNKGVLEALIESGSLDELTQPQQAYLMSRDVKMEILNQERNRLGAYVSDHPVIGIWDTLEPNITHKIINIDEAMDGERVKVGGLISTVDRKTTKRGDAMYILTFEDISGAIEVVCFPKEAHRFADTLEEGRIALLEGRVQRDGDEENSIDKLIMTDISFPEISQYQSGHPIYLDFPAHPGIATLNKIHDLIEKNPGDSQVYIKYPKYRHSVILKMQKPTSKEIENNLKLLIQSEKIGV